MLQHREEAASELEEPIRKEFGNIAAKFEKVRESKDLKPKDKNGLRKDLEKQQGRLMGLNDELVGVKRSDTAWTISRSGLA